MCNFCHIKLLIEKFRFCLVGNIFSFDRISKIVYSVSDSTCIICSTKLLTATRGLTWYNQPFLWMFWTHNFRTFQLHLPFPSTDPVSIERFQIQKNKKTKLLCLWNFRLFEDTEEIPLSSPNLHQSDSVSDPGKDRRSSTLSHYCMDKHIQSYPRTSLDTPINIINVKSCYYRTSSKDNIDFLQKSVKSICLLYLGLGKYIKFTSTTKLPNWTINFCLPTIGYNWIPWFGVWESLVFLVWNCE